MTFPNLFKKILVVLLVISTIGWLQYRGTFTSLNNFLVEGRMALTPKRASGNIVYLAIDKTSLDNQVSWPWPRGTYAKVLDGLTSAGATDIFLDIDFSNASTPAEDAKLAAALERAGGSVLLPAFLQLKSAKKEDTRLGENLPLEIFRKNAWLASVNVVPDQDGIARTMFYGALIDGQEIQSVPSMLSAVTGPINERFRINFSLSPDTIPTYSVQELLDGKIGKAELHNKTVVLGAYAVELRDTFAVPVHGLMPGPMMQILAAETLQQNIVPLPLNGLLVLLFAGIVILSSTLIGRPKRLLLQLSGTALLAAILEVAGYILHAQYALILPTTGSHVLLITTATFISAREMDFQKWLTLLARAEKDNGARLLRQIAEDSRDAILVCDEHGSVLEMNHRAVDIFDIKHNSHDELTLDAVVPDKIVAEAEAAILRIKNGATAAPRVSELHFEHDDGQRIVEFTITPSVLKTVKRDKGGQSFENIVTCINARDVTQRRAQARRLEYLSQNDELTGALRRHALVGLIDDHIRDAWGDKNSDIFVFTVNLHRFRTINSTLGRVVGNEVLIEVYKRLKLFDARANHVARLGGDTYALFVATPLLPDEVQLFCKRLSRVIDAPVQLPKTTARVGAHIGIASCNVRDGINAETLLERAEVALEEARQTAGSGVVTFDLASSEAQLQARKIERELWQAMKRDQISVNYQPQVRLSDGFMTGVEALVRWNHPTLGSIPPSEFIEVAEANGFVEELGRWVLHKACFDIAPLPDHIGVAVNVSPLQLVRSDLVHDVKKVLKKSGLKPDRLTLEITESTFLNSSEKLITKLRQLRKVGVKIALDDFGTGYSSLGYLSNFPLDKIKIDRAFVRNLLKDKTSQTIVSSVKILADGLELVVVCEGIETNQQHRYLTQLGCQEGQGYLFSRPVPLQEVLKMAPHKLKLSA